MPKRRARSTALSKTGHSARLRTPLAACAGLLILFSSRPLHARGDSDKHPSKHASEPVSALWVRPPDIASRNLFIGPGSADLVPRPGSAFQYLGEDKTGHSHGYDVVDAQGHKWDVKMGEEAPAEIAVSRILWAIGFHQPVQHYVARWRLTGAPDKESTGQAEPGRFRLASDHKSLGDWSWSDNPFKDTRELRGLIVANLVLNNWDLTPDNNRIYRLGKKSGHHEHWYVVQDVGGSLGKTRWPIGTRNNLEDFESEKLIESARDGKVEMAYRSRHKMLVGQLTPADVVWACTLLDQLSDRQLDDAFRAGGYAKPIRERYIRKIRAKIHEGLSLASREDSSHG